MRVGLPATSRIWTSRPKGDSLGAQARPSWSRPQRGWSGLQITQAWQSGATPPPIGSREAGERAPEPGGPEWTVRAASSTQLTAVHHGASRPVPPCEDRTEAATLPAPSGPRSGYLRRWRRPRRHPNERDESAASPEGFGNLWKTCSALGDSCSLRTRTGRHLRIPPPLPSLPAPRWAGGGSGA